MKKKEYVCALREMNKLKNLSIVLILTVALVVSAVNVSGAYSDEWSAPEEALSFLTDVVRLDTERYNVTLVSSNVRYPSDLGGLPEEIGKYTLEADGSKLTATYNFRNKTMRWLYLYVDQGSPIYTEQPSADLLERTKAFLEGCQRFFEAQEFHKYREILSMVSEVDEISITVDNVRMEIKPNEKSFEWVNTFNGADYTSFSINYRDKGEFAFSDDRYYQIGSTDLDVSKEKAVDIAMERVEDISWTVEGVEVGNVTVLDDHTSVGLLVAPREPLMLYPYWQVGFTFDRVYPGNVYGVTYNIWADTGEIFYGHMHMFGGTIPPEPSPEPTSEPTPQPTEPEPSDPEPSPTPPLTPSLSPTNDLPSKSTLFPQTWILLVAVILFVVFLFIATFLHYTKKPKQRSKTI